MLEKDKDIVIREASEKDCKSITNICQNDLGYDCSESLVKSKLSLIDKRRECVFVALINDKVTGFVHIEKYDVLYSETLANVLGLAVRADSRRNGVGRKLMKEAENWAKKIGAKGIRLNSGIMRTPAHRFYRSLGFDDEKEQIRFMQNFRYNI